MNARTQTVLSYIVLAGASVTAGCGVNQHSGFQNAFLPPPARHSSVDFALDDPPAVEPIAYSKEVPGFLLAEPKLPPRPTRGDMVVEEAERHFTAGKQAYSTGDLATARTEFDLAVDAMLDASDLNPADRVAYEVERDQMVDAIHSFDLAGFGASDTGEEVRFEKAPLEDILQMTFPVDPKIKARVLDQVTATVSQLPLSATDAVLGYVNYFSNRGHGTITVAMQRSGRYRPMIQRILDEEGVPQELIHLAQAEIGLPAARDFSGARRRHVAVHVLAWPASMVWRARRTPTTGWTRRRPPAPPPVICTICTTCSATGTWPWPPTIAVRGRCSGGRAHRLRGLLGTARARRAADRNHQLRPHHSGHDDHGEERSGVRPGPCADGPAA